MAENEKDFEMNASVKQLSDADLSGVAGGQDSSQTSWKAVVYHFCPECGSMVNVSLVSQGRGRSAKEVADPCSKCGKTFADVSELKRLILQVSKTDGVSNVTGTFS